MRDETASWLKYAEKNLQSSKLLLQSSLYNPCLQNVQQSVEKALKAVFLEKAIRLKKTYDVLELKNILLEHDIAIDLSDEDTCQEAIKIAENTLKSVQQVIVG